MTSDATKTMGTWTAIGIAIGVAIGAGLDNVSAGIAIGAGLGAAIGTFIVERHGASERTRDELPR
jgi:hypothetical protein